MKRVFVVLFVAISSIVFSQNVERPKLLPQKVVTNTYHGVTLEDPYQYLENLKDSTVINWMKDNADYADFILKNISGRQAMFDKMKEFYDRKASSINDLSITDNNTYYYLKRAPGEDIQKMYVRQGYEGEEKLFFDPNEYKKEEGKTYIIDDIVPNIQGDKIAVSVSPDGSEIPELLIFKSSGERYDEIIYLGEEVSWNEKGESFYYTKWNSSDVDDMNRLIYTSIYLHQLGENQQEDTIMFSKDNYSELGIERMEIPYLIYLKEIKKEVLIVVSVDKDLKLFINTSDTEEKSWVPILKKENRVINLNEDSEYLYYLTYNEAPNYKIVKTSKHAPSFSNGVTIVEESSSEIITDFKVTIEGLYYSTMKNGVEAKVYFLENGSTMPKQLSLPFKAGEVRLESKGAKFSDIWINISGWTSPTRRFLFKPLTNDFIDQPLSSKVKYPEFENLIVKEIMIQSHDSTMVPVSIIHNKDIKLNGGNPTAIYGYGAYGSSETPFFSPAFLSYTLYGGIWVIAHVRGGGELGDLWHKAGQMLNKPNTWKDAIAAAEYLINQGYTNSKKLTIFGGSAGGILVGRSITERPDLFVAASPIVGAMNTVRMERTPAGPVNTPEFGTVKDLDGFKGLLAMDSYHSLNYGVDYPATLVLAGMNDPRVIAWQPAKFAAKMQHDNMGDSPILLLTDFESGHGGNTLTQFLNDLTGIFSFFYWQSGHPDFELTTSLPKN